MTPMNHWRTVAWGILVLSDMLRDVDQVDQHIRARTRYRRPIR